MKKIVTVLISLVLLVGICWAIDQTYLYDKEGAHVDPGALHTVRNAWVVVDSTTSDGTEPTDPNVSERTYTAIAAAIAAAQNGDDEISIYSIPRGGNAGRFRCIGITDGANVVYEIYLGTLGQGGTDCELAKAGQLDFTIGTQASTTSGYEFADAVTVTAYCWPKSWTTKTPGNELVAETAIDFMGADCMVVVATTAACDCKLLLKVF